MRWVLIFVSFVHNHVQYWQSCVNAPLVFEWVIYLEPISFTGTSAGDLSFVYEKFSADPYLKKRQLLQREINQRRIIDNTVKGDDGWCFVSLLFKCILLEYGMMIIFLTWFYCRHALFTYDPSEGILGEKSFCQKPLACKGRSFLIRRLGCFSWTWYIIFCIIWIWSKSASVTDEP